MTKKNLTTREMILAKALQMFNDRGIEYVGIRELAGELDVHVGNITYYFPKKESLVEAISHQLRELNDATLPEEEETSLFSMLERLRAVFYNHYKFRCLLLSFVQQFENNPALYKQYQKTEVGRRAALVKYLNTLCKTGELQSNLKKTDIEELVSLFTLVTRFWISESRVSYRDKSLDWLIKHYLQLLLNVLEPIATAKGRKGIAQFEKKYL